MTKALHFNLDFLRQHANVRCEALPRSFSGVASFGVAGPEEVTVLRDISGETCRAGACFVGACHQHFLGPQTLALVCDDPWREFVQFLRALVSHHAKPPAPGIHNTAQVHPEAEVPASCWVEAFAVISAGSKLGERCHIGAHSVLGEAVEMGADCYLEPHVTLEHTVLGQRVVLKSGARIGQAGFGFIPGLDGHLDIPHLGRVCIGSDTRIGANVTIDRGTLEDTVIGKGVRIDNLVHLAHNVQVGDYTVMAAQTGISGSCALGAGCMLGGQVGLAPGVKLAAGTAVAAKSGVMHASKEGAQLAGIPAVSADQWRRQVVYWRRKFSRKGGVV